VEAAHRLSIAEDDAASFERERADRRLGLLHELIPKAVRIAVLVNPANATSAEPLLRDMPEAARAIGWQIQVSAVFQVDRNEGARCRAF
jgi:ABC-type uncharacterized transport system substrate-binding protein